MTTKQAATTLGVTPATIRGWIQKGYLKAKPPGGRGRRAGQERPDSWDVDGRSVRALQGKLTRQELPFQRKRRDNRTEALRLHEQGLTLEQIGERFGGISREAVRQKIATARRHLTPEGVRIDVERLTGLPVEQAEALPDGSLVLRIKPVTP